mmetsp:Transcript_16004/g.23232  ORF Transcript_16004/g.23232 Transcript_16004/m.23232 type:complete len:214 (-) Transcript_16004:323-964(-)
MPMKNVFQTMSWKSLQKTAHSVVMVPLLMMQPVILQPLLRKKPAVSDCLERSRRVYQKMNAQIACFVIYHSIPSMKSIVRKLTKLSVPSMTVVHPVKQNTIIIKIASSVSSTPSHSIVVTTVRRRIKSATVMVSPWHPPHHQHPPRPEQNALPNSVISQDVSALTTVLPNVSSMTLPSIYSHRPSVTEPTRSSAILIIVVPLVNRNTQGIKHV